MILNFTRHTGVYAEQLKWEKNVIFIVIVFTLIETFVPSMHFVLYYNALECTILQVVHVV